MSNKYIFAIEGVVDNEAIYYSNILYRRFKKHIKRLKESKLSVNKLMPMPVELKDKVTFYNILDNTQDVEINERSTIKIPTFTTDVDYYSKIFAETNKEKLTNRSLKSIFENKKITNTIIGDKIDYHIDFMKEINEIDLSKEVYIQEVNLLRSLTSGYHKMAEKSLQFGLGLFTADTVTQALTGQGILSFFNRDSLIETAISGGTVFGVYVVLSLIARGKRKSWIKDTARYLRDKMKKLGKKAQEITFGAINALIKHKVVEKVGEKTIETTLGKVISRVDFDSDATHLIASPKSSIDFSAIKVIEKSDKAIRKSLSAAGIENVNDSQLESFKSLGTFADLLFYLAKDKHVKPEYRYSPTQPDSDAIREAIAENDFLRVDSKCYVKEDALKKFLLRIIPDGIIKQNIDINSIVPNTKKIHITTRIPKPLFIQYYIRSSDLKNDFRNKFIEYCKIKQTLIYNKFIKSDDFEIEIENNEIKITFDNKFSIISEFKYDNSSFNRQMLTLRKSIVDSQAITFLGVNFLEIKDTALAHVDDESSYAVSSSDLEAINNTEKHEATEEYRSTFVSKAAMISSIVDTCSDPKSKVNIKKSIGLLVSKDALDVTKLHIALARIGYESASLFTDEKPGVYNAAKLFNDAIAATTQNIECNDESGNFSFDIYQKSILENTLLSCLNFKSRSSHRAKIKTFTKKVYSSGLTSDKIEELISEIYEENDKKPVTEFGIRMEKLIADSFMEILELQALVENDDNGNDANRLEQFLRRKFSDDNDPDENEKIEAIINHIREKERRDVKGNIDHGEAFFKNLRNSISFVLKKGNKTDSEFVLGERNAELLNNILKSSGEYDTIFQETLALPKKGLNNNPTFFQKWEPVLSTTSNLALKTLAGAGLFFSAFAPRIASYLDSDALQPSKTFQRTVDDGKSVKIEMKELHRELLELHQLIDELEIQSEELKFDRCFLHLERALEFAEKDDHLGFEKLFKELGMGYDKSSNADNYSNLISLMYFINTQKSQSNQCINRFNQLEDRLSSINNSNHSREINSITKTMIKRIRQLSEDFHSNKEKYEAIYKRFDEIYSKIVSRDEDLVKELPETYIETGDADITDFFERVKSGDTEYLSDLFDRIARGYDTKYVEKASSGEKILVPEYYETLSGQLKDVNYTISEKTITAVTTRARYEAFENNRIVIALNIVKNTVGLISGYVHDEFSEVISEMTDRAAEHVRVQALRSSSLASGRIEALIKILSLILTSILFRFFKQLKLRKGFQGALKDAQDHIRIATNFTVYHIESQILRNDIISVLDLNTKIMELTLQELLTEHDDDPKIKKALKKIEVIRESIAKETLKTKQADDVNDIGALLRKLEIIDQ